MEVTQSFSEKLLTLLKQPYFVDMHHLYVTASIGINQITDDTRNVNQFIKETDIAMYEAKAEGRDAIMLFNNDLAKRVERDLEIERKLYFALEHDEIKLQYQPQVDRREKIIGCEALVHWKSSKMGHVVPTEFISIAEKTGLIIDLGNYIIEEAFKTLQSWDAKGLVLEFHLPCGMRS